MPEITIKCPKTERLIGTGIDVPSIDSIVLLENSIGPCPHCGERHVWSVRDGVIEVR